MTSPSCQLLRNVKLLSVHVMCVCVYVKHQVSIIPILCTSFRYLDFQVTMFDLSTRIFLFNWHFLHVIPTLFVFLITHLPKSSTNTLELSFCLFLTRVFRCYSGLLAFLSLHFLQILQMVQDCHVYMTVLQQ